jgi:hypothetical protein
VGLAFRGLLEQNKNQEAAVWFRAEELGRFPRLSMIAWGQNQPNRDGSRHIQCRGYQLLDFHH